VTKVKICGVTNGQDALWAANLGADFVGLNFYSQSPRKVSAKNAKDIAAQLPPFITVVGIFVDEPLASIEKLVKNVPLKAVQLHGNEPPEFCAQVKALGVKVIKAFRLQAPVDPTALAPYQPVVDFFLFDHYSPDAPGGTGQPFDLSWAQPASSLGKPWFLSGGLKPDTVASMVKQSQPTGVDVCSGVERSPTRKDYDAMKTFIQAVKAIR
jgi:phosphoribosylanthranilate isomerase